MTEKSVLTHAHTVYLVTLGGLLLGIAGCDSSGGAPKRVEERSALLVSVDELSSSAEYGVQREYVGRVEPVRQSQIGFELGGTLLELTADEGDEISGGQAVARLDTARLEAQLAEAAAMLDQALSARRYAERTLQRNAEAAEFEGISKQELDVALDAANAARAQVAAARAQVNSVQVDIDKSLLHAPYDAIVVRRRLDEGDTVAPGLAVLDLQERALPEVRVGISGDLVPSLRPGQARQLTINAREVRATIRTVIPVRDPSTRTVDVILQLMEEDSAVPGDLARLQVERTISEDGFWLPLDALAEGNHGLWNAYVAVPLEGRSVAANGATHYLEPRVVEVLHEDSSRVFVRGALEAGELFVTNGLQRVVPNQEVRIAGKSAVASTAPEADGS
jgi:RND family efflux transporter MFP subunit